MKKVFIPAISSEEGFTIQELMVVLVVGSLLVGMTLSLFLFSQKLVFSWQRKSDVKSSVSSILQTITQDVLSSKSIVDVNDTLLILSKHDDRDNIMYVYTKNALRRNNDTLHKSDKMLLRLKFASSNSASVRILKIKASGELKGDMYQGETEVSVPYSSKEEFNHVKN